jgi:hypothetical protein
LRHPGAPMADRGSPALAVRNGPLMAQAWLMDEPRPRRRYRGFRRSALCGHAGTQPWPGLPAGGSWEPTRHSRQLAPAAATALPRYDPPSAQPAAQPGLSHHRSCGAEPDDQAAARHSCASIIRLTVSCVVPHSSAARR